MKNKTIYYRDLKNDDFAGTNITPKPLKDTYRYVNTNIFLRLWDFFFYFIIAKPILILITKIKYHQKFVNKKCIKESIKTGAFLFGNHTTMLADAFVPNYLVYKKRNYIIVSPETSSMPIIRGIVKTLGALPLTNKITLKKKFLKAVKYRAEQNAFITIYPEAHIWPYYTKIRPFDETSFKYPVIFDKPVYAITTCYQKKKFSKKPKILTFIDGPYYPKPELEKNENAKYLRDLVYNKMVERSNEYSTYEYVKYIKIEDKEL